MLTGRKLWESTKCPCVNHIKLKYGNAHNRYIQSHARCDFGLSKKPVYMAERRLLGVEKHVTFYNNFVISNALNIISII